jgi:hypothetical protein
MTELAALHNDFAAPDGLSRSHRDRSPPAEQHSEGHPKPVEGQPRPSGPLRIRREVHDVPVGSGSRPLRLAVRTPRSCPPNREPEVVGVSGVDARDGTLGPVLPNVRATKAHSPSRVDGREHHHRAGDHRSDDELPRGHRANTRACSALGHRMCLSTATHRTLPGLHAHAFAPSPYVTSPGASHTKVGGRRVQPATTICAWLGRTNFIETLDGSSVRSGKSES